MREGAKKQNLGRSKTWGDGSARKKGVAGRKLRGTSWLASGETTILNRLGKRRKNWGGGRIKTAKSGKTDQTNGTTLFKCEASGDGIKEHRKRGKKRQKGIGKEIKAAWKTRKKDGGAKGTALN